MRNSFSANAALICAVRDNNLEEAALQIQNGADVNYRSVDDERLKSAHDMLISSTSAQNIYDISQISIPFDVPVAIVYAVCLIICGEYVQPEMTQLHVWYVGSNCAQRQKNC